MTTSEAPPGVLLPAYPVHRSALPEGRLRDGRYELTFARTIEDLRAVQRLRAELFPASRDEDELDAACHHLMVIERGTSVVGSYRLMIEPMARARGGFCSERDFDVAELPDRIRRLGVEVGTACIAAPHRNGRVVHLLWRGLARYLVHNRRRYLFGSCSLPTADAIAAHRMHEQLQSLGRTHGEIRVEPRPERRAEVDPDATARDVLLPSLFASYLSLGARVCSGPAIDRGLKTTHFFVLLDVDAMLGRHRRSFLDQGEPWEPSAGSART